MLPCLVVPTSESQEGIHHGDTEARRGVLRFQNLLSLLRASVSPWLLFESPDDDRSRFELVCFLLVATAFL